MTNESTSSSEPRADHLAAALEVTKGIVAGVSPDQAHVPTPCPEYDVSRLLDHLVGFGASFADKANSVPSPADPAKVTAGDDPARAYDAVSRRLLEGYRGGEGEGATPIGVVLMETVIHGWDLAKGTGQPAPYPDDAVEAALAAGQGMMSPKFRGEGQPFGDEVEVSSDAPALDRLVAFMGRDPGWSA
jgi:uncharacterized protein (TIGR03086 family)